MTRRLYRLARLLALLTVAAVALLFAFAGRRELVIHVYVLALAAIGLFQLVAAVRAASPRAGASAFDAALRSRARREERLPELAQLEREVTLGMATAFDLHYRLRPSLRRIAGELLASRRGTSLDGQPARARSVLGEETWELVRVDRRPPDNRYAPGIGVERLGTVVAALERI